MAERTGIDPEFTARGSLEALLDENQVRTADRKVRASESPRDEYGRPILELPTPEQARALEPHLTAELPACARALPSVARISVTRRGVNT